MSADDHLDQDRWPDAWGDVARAVLADLGTGAKREQAIRAVALQAAAAVFAGWIETGEKPKERL